MRVYLLNNKKQNQSKKDCHEYVEHIESLFMGSYINKVHRLLYGHHDNKIETDMTKLLN